MSLSKSKEMEIVATIVIIIAFVLVLTVLIVKMFVGDSSYVSTGDKASSVDVLSCAADTKNRSFFDTDLADKVDQKITVTFSNGRPDEISYNISATYSNKESFNKEGRIWVTDYGLYMSDNDLREDSIKNTFSSTENKAWANFYTKASDINAITAKIFLLDENYLVEQSYDMPKLGQYYASLGFNCNEINNKEANEK